MSAKFTTEQLLTRFEDRREIINLMARYAADYLLKNERNMFANYWSQRPDVVRAVNEGYYTGTASIQAYYAALDEKNKLIASLIRKKFPEKFEGMTDEQIYGVGNIGYKPLDTGVVEIASDGKTAKGMWTLRGSFADLTTQGIVSYWVWGWMAADFVWENNEWKLWHLMEVYDIKNPCGTSWANGPSETSYDEEPIFAPMADFKLPEPDVKTTVREYYTTRRPATPSPRVPEPYDTFDETFSYGM